MHTLHVVEQIPSPGETIAGDRAIAFREITKVRFLAVTVHPVSFTLVAQKTSRGGELGLGAGGDLASVGLKVGVKVFTVGYNISLGAHGVQGK